MEQPTTIDAYVHRFSNELGERILQSFPPLHSPDDPPSPLLGKLLRRPYPGQVLAVMGVVRRLARARSAAVVAECGTGKTLISLASAYVAAEGKPFTRAKSFDGQMGSGIATNGPQGAGLFDRWHARFHVQEPERHSGGQTAPRKLFSPLWQAERTKVRRYAVIEFIGRYLSDFFDFGIADEVHELKGGDTAQGNALGTLAGCVKKLIILTGTLLGGYADDIYNILFRAEASKMIEYGFEHHEGVRPFMETYGLLETITTIEPAENACLEAKVTRRVRRRPGASPQLFGDFLMPMAAFLSLEDIAQALPSYREEVVPVEMDEPLRKAYEKLEEQIKEALKKHRGNNSVVSVGMNALLLCPDRPFGMGTLYGWEYDPEAGRRERFEIAEPEDLDQNFLYAKERKLLEDIHSSLSRRRKVHVFAVYTRTRDAAVGADSSARGHSRGGAHG